MAEQLQVDTRQAQQAVEDLKKKVDEAGAAFTTMRNAILAAGAAIAAGFTAAVASAINSVGDLVDMSKSIGISAKEFDILARSAALAGVDIDELRSAMQRLQVNGIEAINKGSGPAIDAFRKLGLEVQDISKLPADQQLAKITEALRGIEDPAQRSALAVDLLGKSGPRLLEAADATNRIRQEMQAMGLALSDLDFAAIDQAGDSLDELKGIFSAITRVIAAELAPYIVAFVKYLKEAIKEGGGIGNIIRERVIPAIEFAVKAAVAFVSVVASTAVITAVANIVTGFVAVSRAITAASGAAAVLNAVIGANPIVKIIGLVVGLGAAALGVMKVGEEFDKFEQQAAAALKQINDDVEKLKTEAADLKNGPEVASEAFIKLRDAAKSAVDNFTSAVDTQKEQIRNATALIGLTKEQSYLQGELAKVDEQFKKAKEALGKEQEKLNDQISRQPKGADKEQIRQQQVLTDAVAQLTTQYKNQRKEVEGLAEAYNARSIAEQLKTEQERVDKIVTSYGQLNTEFGKQLGRQILLIGASDAQKAAMTDLAKLEDDYLRQVRPLQEQILELRKEDNALNNGKIKILEQTIATLNAQFGIEKKGLEDVINLREQVIQQEKLREFQRKTAQDTERELKKLENERAKLGLSAIEQKYKDIQFAAEESARAQINAEQQRRGAPLAQSEIEEYYRVAREGADRLQEATRLHYEESRTWSVGWSKAYQDYVDSATNAAKSAEEIFRKATSGMEDMIVNFAKTGKFEWKNFVASMAEELLRSQVRQLLTNILNMGGQGSSKGTSIFGNLFGGFFATGGMIPPGRFGVVGEAGPELVTGPAGVTPLQATNVTYNINAVDALSFKQLISSDPGFIHAVAMQGGKGMASRR